MATIAPVSCLRSGAGGAGTTGFGIFGAFGAEPRPRKPSPHIAILQYVSVRAFQLVSTPSARTARGPSHDVFRLLLHRVPYWHQRQVHGVLILEPSEQQLRNLCVQV